MLYIVQVHMRPDRINCFEYRIRVDISKTAKTNVNIYYSTDLKKTF